MAQIGWIDFSAQDRQRVKQIIERIRPEGQLDELGVGYLRDNIANLLFPGISTIQTKAKYFFIVPYIMIDYIYLEKKPKEKKLYDYLQNEEHRVKNLLRIKYAGQEKTGVIGITLSESKRVKRNPSEIYWSGLNTFGCIHSQDIIGRQLSLRNFLSNIEKHETLEKAEIKNNEDQDETMNSDDSLLGIKVPIPDRNWKVPENITIELNEIEAKFLRDQFLYFENPTLKLSLIPEFVKNEALKELLFTSDNFQDFVLKTRYIDVSEEKRKNLITAYNFAKLIEIAHLIYDDMLQKKFYPEEYDKRFYDEAVSLIKNMSQVFINPDNFDLNSVFLLSHRRIIPSEKFISQLWVLIKKSQEDLNTVYPQIEKLIGCRESYNKGKKSRLNHTKQYNSDLSPNKRISLTMFQYRLQNVRTLFKDIDNALN